MLHKGWRRTQNANTSSSTTLIKPAIKAVTNSQAIIHDNEEMHDFEDTAGKKVTTKSGKSPNGRKNEGKQRRRQINVELPSRWTTNRALARPKEKASKTWVQQSRQITMVRGLASCRKPSSCCKTFPQVWKWYAATYTRCKRS